MSCSIFHYACAKIDAESNRHPAQILRHCSPTHMSITTENRKLTVGHAAGARGHLMERSHDDNERPIHCST